MKSYRFFGEEMESLGNRLDHCRKMVSTAKSPWAKQYWQSNLNRLMFQWKQLPILHDGDAQVTIIPKWTVSYDYYETGSRAEGQNMSDRFYDLVFNHDANLDASWHYHREQRLARAQ